MQLDLFSPIVDGVNRLIDALNNGRKPKEMYYAIELYEITDNRFLCFVMDKNKSAMFNIVDKNGKVPDGFSVCWRIWQHVSKELNISISDLDKFTIIHYGAITDKL